MNRRAPPVSHRRRRGFYFERAFPGPGEEGRSLPIIVSNIRLPLREKAAPGDGENEAVEAALRRLRIGRAEVKNGYLVKTSVDARHREVELVCSVGVELADEEAEEKATARAGTGATLRRRTVYDPPVGSNPLPHRPLVVGFGPAGMFAGLLLARRGYRPLILERGGRMEERVCAVRAFWESGKLDGGCNVQFGEGGAGTFSDGKLTTRINDPRCELVLREFAAFGAPPEILREAKPHIGTDRLRGVVTALRREIEACGGEIRFRTALKGFASESGRLRGALLSDGSAVPCEALILAPGHSARDTFRMLAENGAALAPKPFSVGVRVEHLQTEIEKSLYGAFAGHPALPRGEYQLSLREGERAVYTFCMCPGGEVVAAASEENGVVTNGMSEFRRAGNNANAALVVSVSPGDFGGGPLDGISFQQTLERAAFTAGGGAFRAPAQTVGAYLAGKPGLTAGRVAPTYSRGVREADLHALFPAWVGGMLEKGLRAFDRRLKGFAAADAVMTGVETRTSSPVRILRGENGEAVGVGGLFPAGEGAGYAGGIMSAAVDGLRAAEAVMAQYRPD